MNKIKVFLKWNVLRTRLYLERLNPKAFFLPLIIFTIGSFAIATYYSFFRFTDMWTGWNLASGNAFHFCEANHMDQLIRQPSNTWSNLAFFVVGLITLTLGIHDLKYAERKSSDNFLVRYPVFSIMFGLSALYLFIGSFMYHASLTQTFQHLDQTGLYSVIVMVMAFNLYKIFPVIRIKGEYRSSHGLMVAFAVGLNYLIFTRLWMIEINILFPVMIMVVFLTSCYYMLFVSKEHYFTNYLWAAFAILVLAGIIWILDRTSIVCNPESMFQGHALWHLLCAASIMFIYLYYRSGTVPLAETIADREERRMLRKNRM